MEPTVSTKNTKNEILAAYFPRAEFLYPTDGGLKPRL